MWDLGFWGLWKGEIWCAGSPLTEAARRPSESTVNIVGAYFVATLDLRWRSSMPALARRSASSRSAASPPSCRTKSAQSSVVADAMACACQVIPLLSIIFSSLLRCHLSSSEVERAALARERDALCVPVEDQSSRQ